MNRSCTPSAIAQCSRSGASCSLTPRSSTELILTGSSPAERAARTPASTSGSRRRRLRVAKVSGSSVSSEMLIRSSPAAASPAARAASPIPLVVIAIDGRGRRAAIPATSASRFLRSSGSPPVSRTVVMPSRDTPIPTSRRISSSVSRSSFGSQGRPSAGMQ